MVFLLWLTLLTATEPRGVVVVAVANMYSVPTEEADVVSQAICGTNVAVAEEKDGWVQVRTPDDYTGWMPLASLRTLGTDEQPYASAGQVLQVESLFANLYREPDVTKCQPLLTVPFEARLEIVTEQEGEEGRWLEVRLPDNRSAWVQRGDVAFDPRPLTIPQTIALSQRFMGLPYLWGGTSSFGYDCSGFTQMLMRRRGITTPRDAGPQMRWEGFVPVERSALQPGDLLFFGPSAEKIAHSGMYIGGGEFIHATVWLKPVVQISRLDDPHWTALLVACRRLK